MLPMILARQLRQGLEDYIRTTFPMTNAPFAGSLDAFFREGVGVCREPYLSVKLPLRMAKIDASTLGFEGVTLPFPPYVHQAQAYARLLGEAGRSTLIATGTGSGKTECFLYPVLEYCWQHRGEPGIKALLIYPMNALATDQAGRIAAAIEGMPKLREAHIRAGMYVGAGSGRHAAAQDGAPHRPQVITDHEQMLVSPPDILLTNYKMLDYLLVRPHDTRIWAANGPRTLKYIVVDEFHTFDGAQGTDLACLLRRLKSRLATPPGYLCCVGTSATMGGGTDAESLRTYAQEIFGESLEDDAVLTEDRLTPEEFFAGKTRRYEALPAAGDVSELVALAEGAAADGNAEAAYLTRAAACFFPDAGLRFGDGDAQARLELGRRLSEHGFFQDVLQEMRGNWWQMPALADGLARKYAEVAAWEPKAAGLEALFALVAYARTGTKERLRPFLFVQVQLWMRELRRLMGRVDGEDVRYMLAADLNHAQHKEYLPVVNCRECGATGWAGLVDEHQQVHARPLETFYNLFFRASQDIVFLYPGCEQPGSRELRPAKFCPTCHKLVFDGTEDVCPDDGATYLRVLVPQQQTLGTKSQRQYVCPFCGSHRGVSLMGLRAATEISTHLSQIMASPFNDDKKVLAFSDSVQDAAHRAGFFEGRTWRSGLRVAMERYVQRGGAGKTLRAFVRGFLAYWEKMLTPEAFVSQFIPPNLTWREAYQDLVKTGAWGKHPRAKALWADIERRLAYEILLEFGVSSRIGRTLEKSGCARMAVPAGDVKELAARVQARVQTELDVLQGAPLAWFEELSAGWLRAAREAGAIAVQGGVFESPVQPNPVRKFCEQNLERGAFNGFWLMSTQEHSWLPSMQRGRNTPHFLYDACGAKGKKCPRAFETAGSRRYRSLVEDALETADATDLLLHDEMLPEEISRIIFEEAKSNEIGLLDVLAESPAGERVYGLSMERMKIGKGEGPLDYYGHLYATGDLVRIHAKEHTGMLAREDREDVETAFKRKGEDRRPWDPNVLSCTPTLEMGIDIGDLSTVILCSMPPGQAQFQQRVGRAGRTDGNALVLVVANAQPHDLYFYADPRDMIEGAPEAPHVFLRASAVLERQFLAYCLDGFAQELGAEALIPAKLGSILQALPRRDAASFPYNFLHRMGRRLVLDQNMFFSLFPGELDAAAKKELQAYLHGSGGGVAEAPVGVRILGAFEEVRKEIDALNDHIHAIQAQVKELQKKPDDPSFRKEIQELLREQSALADVKQSINNKNTFNFLSDEGLIPNYAFPEAGVTLKAVLFRKREEGGEDAPGRASGGTRRSENFVYEYQRAASSALSEFAPENVFYAGGHQFAIDQVDVQTMHVEPWRLCPNCAHAEREADVRTRTACPRCGDPHWGDGGQVRNMLRVRMVYSRMPMQQSLIDDSSDSRTVKFYTKQLLVDIDEAHAIERAYEMSNDEFPFGYEFVRRATLREINFGEADLGSAGKMRVNGQEEARKGFSICPSCGRIADAKGRVHHAPYCKIREQATLAAEQAADCIFLYREFQTEALRVLIPETTAAGERVRTESFVAAVMLGLREQFGNVDHLRASVTDVPAEGAGYRKQYLVIYDSVPGGTGYLKQLAQNPDMFPGVLEKALHVLETCSCREDPEKDGCYHCLYAYRQSRSIGDISRRTAIELLRQILAGRDHIEERKTIADIATNALFDSELERMFIEALERMGSARRRVTMQQCLVHDKKGYLLTITTGAKDAPSDADGESAGRTFTWEVEPQVMLDAGDGVAVPCKPDFVLWPAFAHDAAHGHHLPVAVFTDGFQFHRDRVADDTRKRMAILRSGRYRVWSLSYQDVRTVFEPQDEYADALLDPARMPMQGTMRQKVLQKFGGSSLHPEKARAMDVLFDYLSCADAERQFAMQAQAYGMELIDSGHAKARTAEEFAMWKEQLQRLEVQAPLLAAGEAFSEKAAMGKTVFATWRPSAAFPEGLAVRSGFSLTEKTLVTVAWLDDRDFERAGFSRAWNGFWPFVSVMQFAPHFLAVTERGLAEQAYTALRPVAPEAADAPREATSADVPTGSGWTEVCEEYEGEEVALAYFRALAAAGVPVPDLIGADITQDGVVLGTVELGWSKEKAAFVWNLDEAAGLAAAGWNIFDTKKSAADAAKLVGGDEA